jgi:hypothetical protein
VPRAIAVVVEIGNKRVFASALDWPGWSRSGRDEAAALEALAEYAARYAPVARTAQLAFPRVPSFEVVEQLRGSASTDFGVPGTIAEHERLPAKRADAVRMSALVTASWAQLDLVAHRAPAVLRKGPRGGGRDRDAVVAHVITAETIYARKLGLREREPTPGDTRARGKLRASILRALEIVGADSATTPWPTRYAARRIAWHALDHAWEIEDRSALAPTGP